MRKIGNTFVMRSGAGGAWTLTVAGRTAGEAQYVPVIPFDHDGNRCRPIGDHTYYEQLPDAADHPTFRLKAPNQQSLMLEVHPHP